MTTEQYEIQPYTETPVPGTGLVVYHQGDEESWVHVRADGDIELRGSVDWVIRHAPTEPPEHLWMVWSNSYGLWRRTDGWASDVLTAGRFTRAVAEARVNGQTWAEGRPMPPEVLIPAASAELLVSGEAPETIRGQIRAANAAAVEARKAAAQ